MLTLQVGNAYVAKKDGAWHLGDHEFSQELSEVISAQIDQSANEFMKKVSSILAVNLVNKRS